LGDGSVFADAAGGPGILVFPARVPADLPAKGGTAFDYDMAYEWDKKVPAKGWAWEQCGADADFVTLLVPCPAGAQPEAVALDARVDGEMVTADIRVGGARWTVSLEADGTSRCLPGAP
jgi:hypothetical protein